MERKTMPMRTAFRRVTVNQQELHVKTRNWLNAMKLRYCFRFVLSKWD